mgnify:CR=1 FL=1
MDGAHKLYETDLSADAAIVIGNEGNGADKVFLEKTKTLSIPMDGDTESLNAALAGAIIMYESHRQRLVGKK